MFEPIFSEQVIDFIAKVAKKDTVIGQAINKKIKEILGRDAQTIQFYKNLTGVLKQFKRVHITEWLVLIFEVDSENNRVVFYKIGHRDDVYKK